MLSNYHKAKANPWLQTECKRGLIFVAKSAATSCMKRESSPEKEKPSKQLEVARKWKRRWKKMEKFPHNHRSSLSFCCLLLPNFLHHLLFIYYPNSRAMKSSTTTTLCLKPLITKKWKTIKHPPLSLLTLTISLWPDDRSTVTMYVFFGVITIILKPCTPSASCKVHPGTEMTLFN